MKTTVYVCDKCRQAKQENELVEVKASLILPKGFSDVSFNTMISTKEPKHMCKECLQTLGLFKDSLDGDKVVKQKEPELKDRLYDVLNDLLVELGVVFEN